MGLKKQLERFRKAAEPEPTATATPAPVPGFPYSKQPPDFVTYNIDEATPLESVLIVCGLYNALLAKGFGVPVVGLIAGWHPAHMKQPFANAKRIEVVISRVPHYVKPSPELVQAAAKSANVGENLDFVRSIAADPRIRERCVISNGGVFEMARLRRQVGNDLMARDEYLNRFAELPSDVEALTRLCMPPKQEPKLRESHDPSLYWDYDMNPVAPGLEQATGTGGRDTRRGDLEMMRAVVAAKRDDPKGQWDIVDELQQAEAESMRAKLAECEEKPPVFDTLGFRVRNQ